MDALKRQQINEILTCDRNMNLRVLALQRKQVALMGPEGGETGVVLNQEVIRLTRVLLASSLCWTNGELIFLLSFNGTTLQAIGCIGMQCAI